MSDTPDKAGASSAEDAAALEREQLLHHEYDGIREYDNPMPRWWKWIFWASFYFSIFYVFHYHFGNGVSVAASYETDVAEAREREAQALLGSEITEQSLTTLMADTAMMADAKKLFVQRCAQCHGNEGEGLIGPNLTDAYWLNCDGTLLGVHRVISEGVTSKGMPAWNRQLRPIELGKVAAFVGSIRNTNLAGPKGPEGTLVGTDAAASPTAPPGTAPAGTAPASPTAPTAPAAASPASPAAPTATAPTATAPAAPTGTAPTGSAGSPSPSEAPSPAP